MPNVIAFDYEFRHPGHGDQSVHDPRKSHGYKIGSAKAATPEQAAGRVIAAREAFAAGGGTLITNPTMKQVVQARKDVKAARDVLFEKQKKGELTAEDKTAMDGLSLSQHAIANAEGGGSGTLTLAYAKGPNGKPVIAGTMLTVTTGGGELGVMFIGSTGTAKGAGSAMMHSAMSSALSSGKPFVVKAPDDKAVPFYKALGLTVAPGDTMTIPKAGLTKFVKLVGD
jgi:hypothetical protein